ncbi:MAG: site-2 protease family protein [Candidatus Omnitrophica bacterium]|nr:site-2 protease family protein [Candidatus Omnitrophota bacterium]
MAIIVFIIILSILIVVHEWGHFITAKKCGVKVEQFSLGFGPKLFSRVLDNTEFCLCLIPLGGYVKMAGDERARVTGNPEEFLSKSVGQKSLIVVMGPVVNLLFAYLCFWLVFNIGKVDLDATAKRVPAVVGQVLASSPASKAGLMVKDKVLIINDQPITHWPDLQDYVSKSKTSSLKITLNRDGQTIVKELVPEDHLQKDIFGREHNIRRIGVGPLQVQNSQDIVIVRYGPIESFGQAAIELWDITIKTYSALYEMLIGLRSPKEAMGIVGMFFVIKFALTVGFSFLLHILGVISASLALFNLLPLIPLDGGHLLLFLIEKVRGKVLSEKVDGIIAKAGVSLILLLAVFVFYVDFERIGLIDHVFKIFRG